MEMPNNVVKSFSDRTGKSESEIESIWKATEAQVKKEYPDKEDIYGLVTSIVKKKIGLKEDWNVKDLIRKKLNETNK